MRLPIVFSVLLLVLTANASGADDSNPFPSGDVVAAQFGPGQRQHLGDHIVHLDLISSRRRLPDKRANTAEDVAGKAALHRVGLDQDE